MEKEELKKIREQTILRLKAEAFDLIKQEGKLTVQLNKLHEDQLKKINQIKELQEKNA